jgi:hypothetical protein
MTCRFTGGSGRRPADECRPGSSRRLWRRRACLFVTPEHNSFNPQRCEERDRLGRAPSRPEFLEPQAGRDHRDIARRTRQLPATSAAAWQPGHAVMGGEAYVAFKPGPQTVRSRMKACLSSGTALSTAWRRWWPGLPIRSGRRRDRARAVGTSCGVSHWVRAGASHRAGRAHRQRHSGGPALAGRSSDPSLQGLHASHRCKSDDELPERLATRPTRDDFAGRRTVLARVGQSKIRDCR